MIKLPNGVMCQICKEQITDASKKPWVLLNRFVVSSGQAYDAMEVQDAHANTIWETRRNGFTEDRASGVLLHYGECMNTYLEGCMIEADISQGLTQ